MKVLFILGDSAVGKMTVGQELCKITDFRLMHNHLTIEPVLEMFGYYDIKVVTKLRMTLLEEFAKTCEYGLIITLMIDFDRKFDWDYLDKLKSAFDEDTEFYYVELDASLDTRLERNTSKNRIKHKPSKRDIRESERLLIESYNNGRFESYDGEIKFDNFMRIRNDNISAREAAEMIKDQFRFL